MIKRILKKDIRRRKSVNIILFLFITMASVFLSSSINNILVVYSAVDYYMDYANVPDINLIVEGDREKEKIDKWLEQEVPGTEGFSYETMIPLNEKGVKIEKNGKEKTYFTDGISIYLSAVTTEFCKVFDQNGEAFTLKHGEIAVPNSSARRNGLEEGDKITVSIDGLEEKFTVKFITKDAAYGSEMIGMERLVVNRGDYEYFADDEKVQFLGMYYLNTENENKFIQELNNQEFLTVLNSITSSMHKMMYAFDMVIAALLILIGVCLILIALLVLRFTLVFTMEEDYREIGIMKAMGLKGFTIKKMYMIKYLFLVIAGAVLGLVCSIPVSEIMVDSVNENMIMKSSRANLWMNVLCTMIIIVFVLLFCYGCTRKLNKVSAITAIRGGQTGERYHKRAGLHLYKRKWMRVVMFLGLNDMLRHIKRYIVLVITFCLSFILITIPLNTLNTMNSSEMVSKFCLNPDSSVYVKKIEIPGEAAYKSVPALKTGLDRLKKELKDVGYEAKLTAAPIYFIPYSEPGEGNSYKIMTIQTIGAEQEFLSYDEGYAPVLSNEIAFSKHILEQNDWKIGDSVEANINGETKRFLITASYSDYMQLGSSARLNSELDCSEVVMFDYWTTMVDIQTEKTQQELGAELNEKLPNYDWCDAQEIIDINIGGVQQSLDTLLLPMTGMLCFVIMLITLLMERLFIVREKGEIAMMKSMGYRNRTIRLWHVLRMVWVAVISLLLAVPLSLLSNQFILKPIFAIMGAEVTIQVMPWMVYGVYPGVLLIGIIAATMIATTKVNKINIRELNHLE